MSFFNPKDPTSSSYPKAKEETQQHEVESTIIDQVTLGIEQIKEKLNILPKEERQTTEQDTLYDFLENTLDKAQAKLQDKKAEILHHPAINQTVRKQVINKHESNEPKNQ